MEDIKTLDEYCLKMIELVGSCDASLKHKEQYVGLMLRNFSGGDKFFKDHKDAIRERLKIVSKNKQAYNIKKYNNLNIRDIRAARETINNGLFALTFKDAKLATTLSRDSIEALFPEFQERPKSYSATKKTQQKIERLKQKEKSLSNKIRAIALATAISTGVLGPMLIHNHNINQNLNMAKAEYINDYDENMNNDQDERDMLDTQISATWEVLSKIDEGQSISSDEAINLINSNVSASKKLLRSQLERYIPESEQRPDKDLVFCYYNRDTARDPVLGYGNGFDGNASIDTPIVTNAGKAPFERYYDQVLDANNFTNQLISNEDLSNKDMAKLHDFLYNQILEMETNKSDLILKHGNRYFHINIDEIERDRNKFATKETTKNKAKNIDNAQIREDSDYDLSR